MVTASTGYLPIAISAAETKPLAPINNVPATPFACARVGENDVIIHFKRLVAT